MHDEAYHHHHHHHEYPDLAREQTADGWSAIAGLVPGAVEAKVKTEASRYRSSSVTQARSSHSDVPRSSRSVHGTSSSAEAGHRSATSNVKLCKSTFHVIAQAKLQVMFVDGLIPLDSSKILCLVI
eukprot:5807013-Amphidinium_carterae.1